MSDKIAHIRPPLLKSGDTVGVVAPAAHPNRSSLLEGCKIIESWGLYVRLGKHTLSEHAGYLASKDADRLHDIQEMLDDPKIRAIFCARGGYGTTRIIDTLDFTPLLDHPKWIVGFSDITAIHLSLYQLGVQSIHGCMPVQFDRTAYRSSVEAIRRLLQEENTPTLKAPYHPCNRKGKAEGKVIGGNLSLIVDSLATSNSPDTAGTLLVLEEVREPLYRIDRMMTHLKRSGRLNELSGLIIGKIVRLETESPAFGKTIEEIVMEKLETTTYPVAFHFLIGHEPPNLPWCYSSEAVLNVDAHGSTLCF